MSQNNREPERERYYLMPGQGGSNARRRRRLLMAWSVAAGILMAGLMALLMWYFARLKQ